MAALVLLVVHLLLVAWLSLRPLSVLWVTPANLQPLATIQAELRRGPAEAAQCIGVGLLLLAPLGVLLPLATGQTERPRLVPAARTVFAAAMLSTTLEVLQSGVPGRVADVDSVLLNTLGAALAQLLLLPAVRHWMSRRSARRRPPSQLDGARDTTAPARAPVPESAPGSVREADRAGLAP